MRMLAEDELLTVTELQAYLKLPKPTLYAMARNGRIPALKLGKHWRFRRYEINEWLNAKKWTQPPPRRGRPAKSANVGH